MEDRDRETIAQVEKLGCIKNEMTHIWGTAFLIAGGGMTAIINHPDILGYCLGFGGTLIAIVLIQAYFIKRNETIKLIKEIERKK